MNTTRTVPDGINHEKTLMKKTIHRLAERLFAFPIEDYLSSENFHLFAKNHHVADTWAGQLELSKDTRPELYGRDVVKNAFVLFLRHILHSGRKDFPELLTLLLMDFLKLFPCALPLDQLKKDLLCIGYSGEDIDQRFLLLAESERSNGDCPDTC